MTILLCVSVSFEVEVNMTFTRHAGNAARGGHDNIFRLKSADTDNLDVYMFVISPEFMQDINIDVAVLQTIRLTPNAVPILQLEEEVLKRIIRTYMEIIHTNTTFNTEPVYVRSISRCLMAAVVYQSSRWDATAPD